MKFITDVKGELVKKGISQNKVVKELNLHPNTLTNKLNGITAFTVDEAFIVKEKFLPDIDLRSFKRIAGKVS